MSQLILNQEAMPAAPVAGKAVVNIDSADSGRVKAVYPDGHLDILSPIGYRDRNMLLNGEFQYAQRQAPGTLTSYATGNARVYGFDRWAMGIQTSSLQCQVQDNAGTPISSLNARFNGAFKQITAAGKFAIMQVLEGFDSVPLQGRTVRFQFKAWTISSPTTPVYIRFGLLYLTAAGTVDVLPTTLFSAWGANGTDPTPGTNLAFISPVLVDPLGNCTIQNNGQPGVISAAALTTVPQRFSATFQIPSTVLNVIPVIWTNNQFGVNDILYVSEAGLYAGSEVRDWYPRDRSTEFDLLERYYWKSFALATAPAQNVGAATGALTGPVTVAGATALAWRLSVRFPRRLRVAPSAAVTGITTYSPNAATAQPADLTVPVAMTAVSTSDNTEDGVNVTATGGAGGAVGDAGAVHMTVDVDI
jgi:hypothetical protein